MLTDNKCQELMALLLRSRTGTKGRNGGRHGASQTLIQQSTHASSPNPQGQVQQDSSQLQMHMLSPSASTVRDVISYRREAEQYLGQDENLYRLEWVRLFILMKFMKKMALC